LVALAGHRNYDADGAYGGDLLAASADFVEGQGAATSAFLTAYVRALRDLEATDDAGSFAPFDGGFGSLTDGDGLGELQAIVGDALGTDGDLGTLIESGALHRAQTWWGRPANPRTSSPAGAESSVEEE
jgi:hypothetical protein